MKTHGNPFILPAAVTALALTFMPSAQAELLVEWGSTTPRGQADIVTADTPLLNIDATLDGDYSNPGHDTAFNFYYAASAEPAGKNPLFHAAYSGNATAPGVLNYPGSGMDPDKDAMNLTINGGGNGVALWFWGQSMVYDAATADTPSGFTDGLDYGFQNGLNTGNVTLSSIGAFMGVNATGQLSTRDGRYVILKAGTYYISEPIGNVTRGTGNVYTATGAALHALTWAAYDPTTSIALTGSEVFATLPDYSNIQGVGAWASVVSTGTAVRNIYLGGIEAEGFIDTDSDGLPDDYEYTIIDFDTEDDVTGLADVTGPLNSPPLTDFDSDGATDADEYLNGTIPTNDDSDDDGLLDGVETNTDVYNSPSDTGTDPLDPDSDNDTINDAEEVSGELNAYLAGVRRVPFNPGTDPAGDPTDPNLESSDPDNMTDGYEITYQLDPNSDVGEEGNLGDPDGDLVDNELEQADGTDPRKKDTDDDFLWDGDEFTAGTNPLDPDTDDDGFLDGYETDTLEFIDETDTGTSPVFYDSDNDGFTDGREVTAGSDPNVFASTPPAPIVEDWDLTSLGDGAVTSWISGGSLATQANLPEAAGGDPTKDIEGVLFDGDDALEIPTSQNFLRGRPAWSATVIFNADGTQGEGGATGNVNPVNPGTWWGNSFLVGVELPDADSPDWGVGLNSNSELLMGNGGEPSTGHIEEGASQNDGEDHIVTAVFDSAGNRQLYVDGALVVDEPGVSVNTPDQTINFACNILNPDNLLNRAYYTGRISRIQLTDEALPDSAVVALHESFGFVAPASGYDAWIDSYFTGETDLGIIGPDADPDGDDQPNKLEFALGGAPDDGGNNAKLQPIKGVDRFLMTIAVLEGTPEFSAGPAPAATTSGYTYTVQGSVDLETFDSAASPEAPDTTGLPPAPAGYEYRTFSLDSSAGLSGEGFMRVEITP